MTSHLQQRLQDVLGDSHHLLRELGGGGMSRVFLAEETRFHRRVVVKLLAPELAAGLSVQRFEREITTAAQLQQANIVAVITAGEVDGLPWYTMPYVDGESLRQRLDRGRVPLAESIAILKDLARALAYAHGHDIIHRDIKPQNVLLSGGAAVVTDFGIAKALRASRTEASGATLTGTGMSLGTPAYMAPEQAVGDTVDARTDLYSWGVVAYELLTGRHPFAERVTAQQLVAAHLTEVPRPMTGAGREVPQSLADLVMHCLAKDPSQRPRSAGELLAQLDVLDGHGSGESPSGVRRPSGWTQRGWMLVAAAGVVAASAIGVTMARGRTPTNEGGATRTMTLAVLPFANIGRDSAMEYFADGVTDELASDLAKTPMLRVAARRSAYAFRGNTADGKSIGRALGVALLLDGSVRRAGSRVRVTAQLTNAADGIVLWSDSFDGDARDVFAVQDTITAAIVGALRLTLGAESSVQRATVRTRSLEAHDFYLQGRFEAGKHTQSGLRLALDLYRRAAEKDSAYALPWVGMADAYGWLADDYYPAREAYPKAKDAVNRAIRLAPGLAEAHAVLGWILLAYDWKLPDAERELRQAVALDSSSALAHANLSYVLLYRHQPDAALAEMRRALALDPLSAALSTNLEWHLLMQHRYDDVIAQHEVTRRLDPSYFFADSWVGVALRELGRPAEALAIYRAIAAVQDSRPLPGLAVTYARAGDTASARRELARVLEQAKRSHVRPEAVSQIYAVLGDRDRAFEWLQRAVDARSNGVFELPYLAAYDPLRGDPRFARLLARIGGD